MMNITDKAKEFIKEVMEENQVSTIKVFMAGMG